MEHSTNYLKFPLRFAAVQDHGDLDVYAQSVLLTLLRYDLAGECTPSYETIASRSKMTVRQAKAIIRQLVDSGFIYKEPQFDTDGAQSSNRYTIIYSKFSGGAHDAPGGAHHSRGGEPHSPGGEHGAHKRDNPGSKDGRRRVKKSSLRRVPRSKSLFIRSLNNY